MKPYIFIRRVLANVPYLTHFKVKTLTFSINLPLRGLILCLLNASGSDVELTSAELWKEKHQDASMLNNEPQEAVVYCECITAKGRC